jgi:hypothetical protein
VTLLAAVLLGAWNFVAGDDWQTALGVVGALAATAVIAAADIAAWWVMPVATLALLRWSLLRRARALSHTRP